MGKVSNLLHMANTPKPQPPRDTMPDISAMLIASQTAISEAIVKKYSAEIAAKVQAVIAAEIPKVQARVEAAVTAEAKRIIEAMPIPERVIERVVETVTEREERDETPKPVTVQRKDGVIASVKVGDCSYDVIRNKQGMIKEVRPRG